MVCVMDGINGQREKTNNGPGYFDKHVTEWFTEE